MVEDRMILELVGISKRYESPEGAEAAEVLSEISLKVKAGESLAIVGPSGSGKSTLLNLIGALDRPSAGCVILDGQELSQLGEKELAQVRNRKIGFVFQLHHLLGQCTVLENVLIPTLVNRGIDRPEVEVRAKELLQRVGLAERMGYRPGQLSGGERQRAAVVRALINRPKLLLADEPTGSLDRGASDNLAELLVELNQQERVTMIVVTHSLSLAKRMGRVLELREGKLNDEKS
jgi:lipoprotein-releasing system ATP-binding protein